MSEKKRHLSYSAVSRYLTCGKNYEHYYINKIREKTASSFLAFGKAIDNALNVVLEDFKKNKTVSVDYKKTFDEYWHTIEINGNEYFLPDCTLVGYAKYEFIYELLTKEDKKALRVHIQELDPAYSDILLDKVVPILQDKKSAKIITDEEHRLLNLFHWHSARRKAHGMLDAYVREILPNLSDVVEIQKNIKFTTEDDRELIGVIDFIGVSNKYGNKIIIDNKTSRRKYSIDQLYDSRQLALYSVHEQIDYVGFAIMVKEPKFIKEKFCEGCDIYLETRKKRCEVCKEEYAVKEKPVFYTQFLMGKLDESFKKVTMDNFTEVKEAIDKKVFVKNLDKCKNMYGAVCPYYNLCHKDDMTNLEIVVEKEKK